MDAEPPKPPIVAKLTKEEEQRLERIFAEARKNPPKPKPLIVTNGPFKSMSLEFDWTDLGIWPKPAKDFRDKSHGGNRYRHHDYRLIESRCTLRIPNDYKFTNDELSKSMRRLVSQTTGPVQKSEWDNIAVFGMSANPKFFTIESVEVIELADKRVITMTGTNKESGTREKSFYVSLAGDWKEYYEFGVGGSPDKATFESQLAKLDKALKTIVWKSK